MSHVVNWVPVCAADDIDEQDARRFDHRGETYAVYRTPSGYYATAGRCTHEQAHLADGLVLDEVIECPLHNGRFQIATGRALSPPACVNLDIYPVRVEGGQILIGLRR